MRSMSSISASWPASWPAALRCGFFLVSCVDRIYFSLSTPSTYAAQSIDEATRLKLFAVYFTASELIQAVYVLCIGAGNVPSLHRSSVGGGADDPALESRQVNYFGERVTWGGERRYVVSIYNLSTIWCAAQVIRMRRGA